MLFCLKAEKNSLLATALHSGFAYCSLGRTFFYKSEIKAQHQSGMNDMAFLGQLPHTKCPLPLIYLLMFWILVREWTRKKMVQDTELRVSPPTSDGLVCQ